MHHSTGGLLFIMGYLKKRALDGAFWSVVERFSQQGVQFFTSLILARLLVPEDFGLLGMALVFTTLAQSVVNGGFGMALIQKQKTTHTDESTVFWFNLVVGFGMASVIFVAAPWIARFYNVPLLEPIVRLYSLNLIIGSLEVVQSALLIKDLAFKRRIGPTMAGGLISGVLGIAMAWQGFGVWALLAQGLAMNAVRIAGIWAVCPWRPAFVFSMDSLHMLWRFGSHMLFDSLVNSIVKSIHPAVIGKVYSPTDLGIYHRGKQLAWWASNSLFQAILQVNFPLLSKLQDDRKQLRKAFRSVLQATLLVIVPAMTGLAVVAPNLVYFLLGEKWMPCVPYLRVFCAIEVLLPLHALNLNLLAVIGRSDLFFKLGMINRTIFIVSTLLAYRHGVLALVWMNLGCSLVALFINTHFSGKYLHYGIFSQIRDNGPAFLLAGLVVVLCWLVSLWPAEPWKVLLAQVVAGGGVVCVGLALYFRRWGMEDQ